MDKEAVSNQGMAGYEYYPGTVSYAMTATNDHDVPTKIWPAANGFVMEHMGKTYVFQDTDSLTTFLKVNLDGK